jgi:hypothetical protein
MRVRINVLDNTNLKPAHPFLDAFGIILQTFGIIFSDRILCMPPGGRATILGLFERFVYELMIGSNLDALAVEIHEILFDTRYICFVVLETFVGAFA